MNHIALLIKFKTCFDIANFFDIGLRAYDNGVSKVEATFISGFMTTVRILIPKWTHNWRATTMLDVL